jgi:hypothetical protein
VELEILAAQEGRAARPPAAILPAARALPGAETEAMAVTAAAQPYREPRALLLMARQAAREEPEVF